MDFEFSHYISAHTDRSIRLWHQTQQSKPLAVWVRYEADCPSVAFHPNGETFASAWSDGEVRIHLADGDFRIVRRFKWGEQPVQILNFSPEGQFLIYGDIVGGVHIHDLTVEPCRSLIQILPHRVSPVTNIKVSNCCSRLITLNACGELKIWQWPFRRGRKGGPPKHEKAFRLTSNGSRYFCVNENQLFVVTA